MYFYFKVVFFFYFKIILEKLAKFPTINVWTFFVNEKFTMSYRNKLVPEK